MSVQHDPRIVGEHRGSAVAPRSAKLASQPIAGWKGPARTRVDIRHGTAAWACKHFRSIGCIGVRSRHVGHSMRILAGWFHVMHGLHSVPGVTIMRTAIVLSACLLACSCERNSTAADPAPAPAVLPPATPTATTSVAPPKAAAPAVAASAPAAVAEPEDADPRINAIRTRYGAVESALKAEPTRKLESKCNRNTDLSAQLYEADGLQKALVRFHPPGDVSDIYELYFDQGKPVFALYSELGFAGGTTTLTERRYYIVDGKPVRCLSKSAKNAPGEDLSEQEIRKRLQPVENKEADCGKHAKRALALASAVTSIKDSNALAAKLCTL
jgi:hypothetical protein